MRRSGLVSLAAMLFLSTAAFAETPHSVEAMLQGAEGVNFGSVTVTAAPKGVLVHIEASGLPAGWHGLHFHEKADCSDPKFASAGGHVHAGAKIVHGLLNAKANDSGDLPNVHVGSDGTLAVELYSTLASLTKGNKGIMLNDADGFAIVLHAAPDDYQSQPIGGAGARLACAAFKSTAPL